MKSIRFFAIDFSIKKDNSPLCLAQWSERSLLFAVFELFSSLLAFEFETDLRPMIYIK